MDIDSVVRAAMIDALNYQRSNPAFARRLTVDDAGGVCETLKWDGGEYPITLSASYTLDEAPRLSIAMGELQVMACPNGHLDYEHEADLEAIAAFLVPFLNAEEVATICLAGVAVITAIKAMTEAREKALEVAASN